jgi:hypothetical protein
LLAPRAEVAAAARARYGHRPAVGPWAQVLQETFGFPEAWARAHAARLVRWFARERTFCDILGL